MLIHLLRCSSLNDGRLNIAHDNVIGEVFDSIIKVDLLGLSMMSALQDSIAMLRETGVEVDLAHLPPDDPQVYEMLRRADTVGVFQIESRAQMSMLPRLKPRNYYDLVIEVSIVRPGPIVGGMVPFFY